MPGKETMQISRTNKNAIWLLSTLCLCAFLHGPADVVLCLGRDGHVAVEPAHHHDCDAPSNPQRTDPAETCDTATDDPHQGTCVDIPLIASAMPATPPKARLGLQEPIRPCDESAPAFSVAAHPAAQCEVAPPTLHRSLDPTVTTAVLLL
jgi:hypothetical protein